MLKKSLCIVFLLISAQQFILAQGIQTFFQISDKSDLTKITYDSGQIDFESVDFYVDEDIHLLTYDSESGLLCAITHESHTLLMFDQEGDILISEEIVGLPMDENVRLVLAAMDNEGNMYIAGFKNAIFWKYNIYSKDVEEIDFEQSGLGIYDIAYINSSSSLYSISQEGELVRFDLYTETVEISEPIFTKGPYGSIWKDTNHSIYGFNNDNSKVYKYNLLTEQITEIGTAPFQTDFCDGTAILNNNSARIHTQIVSELFTVFPNPNKGKLIISFSDAYPNEATLKIHDLMGSLVFQENLSEFNQEEFFDLSAHLGPGSYILSLENSGEIIGSQQIIVE